MNRKAIFVFGVPALVVVAIVVYSLFQAPLILRYEIPESGRIELFYAENKATVRSDGENGEASDYRYIRDEINSARFFRKNSTSNYTYDVIWLTFYDGNDRFICKLFVCIDGRISANGYFYTDTNGGDAGYYAAAQYVQLD